MSADNARQSGAADAASATVAYLSRRDIDRLTTYKWRYSLESHGFSSRQAEHLLFIKWLYGQGMLRH